MGKGGGCVSSKNKSSKSSNSSKNFTNVPSSTKNLKIFIVFYSMYGHVESLARRIKKGIETVEGVEGVLYRAPETLSNDALNKLQAPLKDSSIPEISSLSDLVDADGFLFGFPTRYIYEKNCNEFYAFN